jgi:hypothetical protein
MESPRPQDQGRSGTLFGREPLRESRALSLTGDGLPAILRFRRERPTRAPDRPAPYVDAHVRLPGSCRTATEDTAEWKIGA